MPTTHDKCCELIRGIPFANAPPLPPRYRTEGDHLSVEAQIAVLVPSHPRLLPALVRWAAFEVEDTRLRGVAGEILDVRRPARAVV